MSDAIPESFRAFRVHKDDDGHRAQVDSIGLADLSEGDVTIRVSHSGINYKDALAGAGAAPIMRRFPMVGGIDVAGTVVASDSERFNEGDEVLVTGAGLSETRDGGYSEYLRVESNWTLPLPAGLSALDAMTIGTAGFTAALSLHRMEAAGQAPEMGPVLVTGATGGVGSIAIDILSNAGYQVHAYSGKEEHFGWLAAMGAEECISRHEVEWGRRPLESARWAGCIDSVGGDTLSGICAAIKPWGNIASCGLAGGIKINTTVMPFIVRGVSLIGIDSPLCPYPIREVIWEKLAGPWKPRNLQMILNRIVGLDDLSDIFGGMLDGQSLGRIVVEL
ncbi:MAG: oxidoreductase [Gammaproteobacteria bacterium]|nr:oxidoreductase [Gammaproteobacteria bacterium]